ncbi:MAG: cobaltochelatase subunit CobN [Pseudomonadota bacterium]
MHLLQAAAGQVSDGSEAVDLGQSPADLIVISAADTELASLSQARAEMKDPPQMRLASLLHLAHPMSVDAYLDATATKSRLVIARVLGGEGYWPYGIEQFTARLAAAGVAFAALPGDDKPDPALARVSTVADADYAALWSYLVESGPENATQFLAYARWMLAGSEGAPPPPARPLLRAGIYWPGAGVADLAALRAEWPDPAAPIVAIVFYRALVQGAGLDPIAGLVRACLAEGLAPLPIFVASLKDAVSAATLAQVFAESPPEIVINATSFAVSSPQTGWQSTPLDAPGVPVLQAVLAGGTEAAWREGMTGLSARDIAMNVALPEVDGRILTRAVSFKGEAYLDDATECSIASYRAAPDRITFTAKLAAAWARLGRKKVSEKRVALILANYPNRDGRLANGVGLDTPAATVGLLEALHEAGYRVFGAPQSPAELMQRIQAGPTNWLPDRSSREGGARLPLDTYLTFWETVPKAIRDQVEQRWGGPEEDPFYGPGGFALSVLEMGHMVVGVQPARGYNIDPDETYHSPDLVPPHHYFAFYAWLREVFGADAVVHLGKHGNLEWLPGKALALSESCYPEAVLGPVPHLYPFIVNDPGEGTQAKRRSAAVIVDHLTPPLTRAETYGPLKELEALVDEYYEASGVDPRRLDYLRRQIRSAVAAAQLEEDAGITPDMAEDDALTRLDTYLCELKEAQIRDGLHIFGKSPEGRLETDLLVALARVPRGDGRGAGASLIRTLAQDLGCDPESFDPLDCALGAPAPDCPALAAIPPPTSLAEPPPTPTHPPVRDGSAGLVGGGEVIGLADAITISDIEAQRRSTAPFSGATVQGPHPGGWAKTSGPPLPGGAWEDAAPYRTNGDAVERLEALAQALVSGNRLADPFWTATAPVLHWIETEMRPALQASGPAEIQGLLTGLDGRFLPPGPSGAPTRGRPDVLPTGRNFYSVDSRAVPTPAAWSLGWHSASLLVERFLQDHGDWPRTMVLTAWGTSNMRTGGDDIAQALALMGVRPKWDQASRRVTGFEILPLEHLDRPRVDVTLRVSGFFRDAFPAQIALVDSAARAVMALDEPGAQNPAAARFRAEGGDTRAGFRVFGSKPGAYGAGLQAMIDERLWESQGDLAEAYLAWGGYAYGAGAEGVADRPLFETRLGQAQAVIQNQDNREHDLLDSDDYYQFEGGAAAAVKHLSGKAPAVYHNDHSRPERPVIRTLEDEVGRVVRARVVNPKWLAGVMRHGYKGAFEIAATIDYMFAFAATTGAVKSRHFDLVHEAVLEDEKVREFIAEANPAALHEIAERLKEAIEKGLWQPRANSARRLLESLQR